ncbi:MAG TPA: hypothetical protein VMT45_15115 [Thermoanaerobaculaceae bacterium]|nr:hypothetical protein [Thermoanaerobaculaceae bacterium]
MSVRMLTPDEAAEFIGVTRRRVLQLPIKQIRVSDRTIRYRLKDIYEHLGIEDPNPFYEQEGGEGVEGG